MPRTEAGRASIPESLDLYFPARTFLAPRVWETASRWFTSDPHTIESVTGSALSCAGGMPVICHRGTLSPSGLSAMADAGLEIARHRLAYSTHYEYGDRVLSLTARSWKAVTPYWTPADVVAPAATWIDPSLLQFLNNKANMAELVPAASLPRRDVIRRDTTAAMRTMALPIVLKVGTNLPNGGGDDMMICRRRRHRRRAARRFDAAECVVFEEMLPISENHCVQYAVNPDEGVTYIGATAQLCRASGAHAGNLLDPASPPAQPLLDLAREIASTGSRLGFSGIAGFDIVVTRDGRVLAIDLNFRLVSSTAQVLLHKRLSKARGLAVSRLAFGSFPGKLDDMLRACRPFIDRGWLVPLATFDPEFGGLGRGDARCRFLVFGDSAADIAAREKDLASIEVVVAGAAVRPKRGTGFILRRLFRKWLYS